MKKRESADANSHFERALKAPAKEEKYILRLYVTGATLRSARAILNIKTICEQQLRGRYHLEVIDIHQQPVLAKGEQIVATPTLIKSLPLPIRRFIGDMSRAEHILLGLDLRQNPNANAFNHEGPSGEIPGEGPRF